VKQASTFWYKYRSLLVGGFLLGLAVLAKGPTAYLVVMLVLLGYWARYRFRNKGYPNHLLLFSAAAALAALAWFGLEVLLHGPEFVKNFVAYQVRLFSTPDAGHRGFFGYHAVVLLLGCFPVSVFALPNIWGDRQPEDEVLESSTLISCMRSDFITWMQFLFWVVLILFSLVTTKIVHYSSLAYFPLTYLGSVTIWRALRWEVQPRWTRWLLPALGVLIGLAAMALPLAGMHPEWIRPWFGRSAFALEALEADAGWAWWQILPGLVMVAATVAGTVWWNRGQPWKAAEYLYTGGALFVGGMLLFCIRPIEAHSQRAAVEFYESKAGEDCFVKPVGFKSYAHLFYTGKPPVHGDKTVDDYPNLSRGNPGKKVYFVAKAGNLKDLPLLPGCREICRKNGFVFFERPAQ
jgi:4-amino-4-deoxy-L-arabinose transferase-like glycosyltransferase